MNRWKAKLLSGFYEHAPQSMVFHLHRRAHAKGIEDWVDHPLTFVHVPKTGGTSIISALDAHDPGHLVLKDLLAEHSKTVKLPMVAVVFRDPVERLISSLKYAYANRKEKGFSSIQSLYRESEPGVITPRRTPAYFHKHFFTRPFTDFVEADRRGCLWVINFDYLESGFADLCMKAGMGKVTLPTLNRSQGSVKVEISQEFREEFLHLYEKDVEVGHALENTTLMSYETLVQKIAARSLA